MSHLRATLPSADQNRPPLDQAISGFTPFPPYESIAPLNTQDTQSLLRLCDTTETVARGIGTVLRLVANNDAEGSNTLRPNTISDLLALCRVAAETLADNALSLQDSVIVRPTAR
ncbi:hypothetical protein [Ralstonia insidiosa]|uniref:DUF3077 domain-containing protein n=1 Tax=Ralstonia insidiosa TaxID=190721 RepID=A0A848P5P8_9RALS|nr:hypothetical protein [Ralstonia insidiosa]NMV40493.1 hypothetical protein [Ralstonia insidiosa]